MVLLACSVAEAYISFKADRRFTAGLWVATLLIKPQYGLVIGPLLLWKREWRAVAGASLGAAGIIAASILAAGPAAVLAYPSSLADLTGFRGSELLGADQMINWRGLILRLAPAIDPRPGTLLVLGLGVMTVAIALWACRGEWQPHKGSFEAQWVVLLVATLLANYHSHVYGMVLLVVPLAALIARAKVGPLTSATTKYLLIVPSVLFVATLSTVLVGLAAELGLIALFASLCWSLRGPLPESRS